MGYKLRGALKKGKAVFIVVAILWIILSIVLIAPITVATVESTAGTGDFITLLFEKFGTTSENFGKILKSDYIGVFGKGELYLVIVLFFFACVGLFKSMPKNEYTDIEHGSSDWATGGEQYQVLSPKKGIILAEKNYLPVDKRGNVNVLVVGRFWFSENLHHMLFQMLTNY